MRSYDIFFFGALFFLLGVLAASISTNTWWFTSGGIALALLAWRQMGRGWNFRRWGRGGWLAMAALLFFMPLGALYYEVNDVRFRRAALPEEPRVFEAKVVSHPLVRDGIQEGILAIEDRELRVLAKFPPYPALAYGDKVTFEGRIEEPFSESYGAYLAKERVRGVVAFPKLITHEPARAFSFRGTLYALRDAIVDSFRRTLPAKEAALMAGITVGAREDFSESFRAAMAESGTTHLVALSGYNIMVVVRYTTFLFLLFLSRRFAFAATLSVILAFVLMTGAEASVVRAAVMGGVALLAHHAGRRYSMRNAIALAALAMVLVNPKVLAFDLGFQLSFLALVGIVYLKPALDSLLGWKGKAVPPPARAGGTQVDVLSWRENLTTTAAAQLAVAPLLIHTFGSVSISSLAANILVLEVVPFTMGLGFILAAVSFASLFAAKLLGFIAFLFLKFQTLVIELFTHLAIPVSGAFSMAAVAVYYGALLFFIVYVRRNNFIPRRV